MKIAVFADDLTGANATGVRISKQGFTATTVIRGSSPPDKNYDALCFDTDSRYEAPETAKKRLIQAMKSIPKDNQPQIYCKRIDSTLRGNIGLEIDTILDELGSETVAIVAAAFPESGRVTVGDFLLVDGLPLQETDVARDPVVPITSSRVTEIIAKQSNKPIAAIGIDQVLKGQEVLCAECQKKIDAGARILVIDASAEEQIDTIAEAMVSLNQNAVAVDPGPLTAAYARATFGKLNKDKKILVTVGSVTSQTVQQLSYLIDKWDLHPIYVHPEKLATFTEAWKDEVDRVAAQAREKIQDEAVIVITTCHPGHKRVDFKTIAERENTSEEALAKRITDGLAAVSREVIQQNPDSVGGCFLSGGDVTASVCAISRANGIELNDEVLPLAAYGHLIGGYLDGMPVVTKGGMVGDKKAISDCVRFLFTKLPNP